MTQNRSSAVMQQRHVAPDALDDFPTAPWATRAVCEFIKATCSPGPMATAEDPAVNRGYMARVLEEYFGEVTGSDCHDYGAGYQVRDFLFGELPAQRNWRISNPPFRLAEAFIKRAFACSDNVAMLVRAAFLEGTARHTGLFAETPPTDILFFSERVVMWQGVLLDPDVPVTTWNEKKGVFETRKPSTATAYCWCLWRAGQRGEKRYDFIPPGTRARLTRPGDYPPMPEHLRPREGGLLGEMG